MGVALAIKRPKIAIVVLLCLLTAAVYLRAAWYPFSGNDDADYVAQNLHVLSGVSLDSISWAFSTFHASNWHPLTWLSLMLDAQFFGSNPAGYHVVNIGLHIANAVLLFYLLTFMTGAVWRSALVAALFALHPQHVESVVWITERKDVLSTLFWLLTLFCYALYVKRQSVRMYLLALAVFALGLMAKPMLVTIPVVLLLLDFWPLGRFELSARRELWWALKAIWPSRLIIEKIPFFALSAVMAVVTVCAQRQTVADIAVLPVSARVSNALWSTVLYAAKMLVPVNLAAYYPLVPVHLWQVVSAAALLGGAAYFAVRFVGRFPFLSVGLFWYLVSLLPVIGLIQVGGQAMADRYTYVPFIGLFIALSWGAGELALRFPQAKPVICATAGLLLCLCSIGTCAQVGYWRDDLTLYTHSLAVTEDNPFAHNVLGIAHEKSGQGEEAVREYLAALSLNPEDAGTRRNLGIVLYRQLGRPAEAVQQLTMAETLQPDNPFTHYHLAKAYVGMGSLPAAVAEYRKALAIKPDDPYFHNDLGMALLQLNDIDGAIEHSSEALRLLPSFGQAAASLQYALSRKNGKAN
jgi:hypothetical protein